MRVFALTELGKKVVNTSWEPTDEFRIMARLKEGKTGTDSELEVVGGRHTIRKLKDRGLIKELTT